MAVAFSSRLHGRFLVTVQLHVSLMSLWPDRATQHSQCCHYFLCRRGAGNVPRPGRLQDPMAHEVRPLMANWASEGREKTECFLTCSVLKPRPKKTHALQSVQIFNQCVDVLWSTIFVTPYPPVSLPLFLLTFCESGQKFPSSAQGHKCLSQSGESGPYSLHRVFAGCVRSFPAAVTIHTGLHSHVAFVYSCPKLWESSHVVLVVISIQTASRPFCNPLPFRGVVLALVPLLGSFTHSSVIWPDTLCYSSPFYTSGLCSYKDNE